MIARSMRVSASDHRPSTLGPATCAFALFWAATAAPALAQETFGHTTPWLPENVFEETGPIDTMFNFILYLTGAVLIAVLVCMVAFMIRYRHRPGRRAVYTHGNHGLEAVWTLIPTIIMALIAAFSQKMWAEMKHPDHMPSAPEAVEVHVLGKQFEGHFHYPGKDGIFGKVHPLWQRDGDSAENFGLRRGDPLDFLDEEKVEEIAADPKRRHLLDPDPAAEDDICVPRLFLPVDRKVHIELTSRDVLHSFFLPNFRIKQDAVPGLTGHVWLRASKTSAAVVGQFGPDRPKPFDIVCAELCGQGHFKMRGQLFVVSRHDFETWLEENAPEDE